MAQLSSLAKVALRGSSWQVSKPLVLVCVESGGTELTGFALSWVVLLEFSMHPLRKMVITRVGTSLSFPLPFACLSSPSLARCYHLLFAFSTSVIQFGGDKHDGRLGNPDCSPSRTHININHPSRASPTQIIKCMSITTGPRCLVSVMNILSMPMSGCVSPFC